MPIKGHSAGSSPYIKQFGTKNTTLCLVLERPTQLPLSSGQILNTKMSKAKGKSAPMTDEVEVIQVEDDPEEDTGGHGVTNPVEACHHIQWLDEAMQTVQAKIYAGEIKNFLKDAIEEVYTAICIVIPTMKEAGTHNVLKSIKDPTCLALHNASEQAEQLLEQLISDEELPSSESVIGRVHREGDLTEE